jgi:peptide/nickel transport system permease protein
MTSPLVQQLRSFRRSRLAVGGAVVLATILLVALFAPLLAPQMPYDLASLNLADARLPPGSAWTNTPGRTYPLGTDAQGRDILSAIMYGLRVSIVVGFSSALIAMAIGSVLGLSAGYAGGRADTVIMRVADIQLSFPAILIAMILLAVSGQGVGKIVIALVAVQWAYYARTMRGAALVERRKEYVDAALLQGLSHGRIVLRHLLPNCLPPLLVVATLQVASAISLEATLSFLGLGLPITEPSLGLLIANGYQHMLSGRYWISVFPGIALMLLIVSVNLVADQLRDILNPRLLEH